MKTPKGLWKKRMVLVVIGLFIGAGFVPGIGSDASNLYDKGNRGSTLYVGGSGPGNYSNIQDAIDNASEGDTVFVYNGVYGGEIEVKKSIFLVGEDRNATIIDGNGSINTIYVFAHNVSVNHFTIKNFIRGLYFHNVSNGTVIHNNFINAGLEVHVGWYYSTDFTVYDNKVNGKDLVYMEDATGGIISDAGQVILIRCEYVTVNSLCISNTSTGIYLLNCFYCSIHDNSFKNITQSGIELAVSHENSFYNNDFINTGFEIHFYSTQNSFINNTVNNKPVVYLENFNGGTVSYAGQVILEHCSNVVVEHIDLSNTSVGIHFIYCNQCSVLNNRITNNTLCGIHIEDSNDITISYNMISNNFEGTLTIPSTMPVEYCSKIMISNNTIIESGLSYIGMISDSIFKDNILKSTEYSGGFFIDRSMNNTIIKNTISNNFTLDLYYSDNNTISHNYFFTPLCEDFFYFFQLFLMDSNNNTISNNILENNTGLFLIGSHYNLLQKNHMKNGMGTWVFDSNNNTLKENFLIENDIGLAVVSSENNEIYENHFISNDVGVVYEPNYYNLFYHNNFIANQEHVEEYTIKSTRNLEYPFGNMDPFNYDIFMRNKEPFEEHFSTCQWDNGYPSGGNYWDDYTGVDNYHGPNQDIPGSDDIGDKPYNISSGDNQDMYPLMEPWNSSLPIHNLDTGEDFESIQAAIDDPDTKDNHTIYVESGTYYENVVIDKIINLTGEDRDITIIDGGGSGYIVTIMVDNVSIEGFSIINSGIGCMGVIDHGYDDLVISNCNVVSNGEAGIDLMGCCDVFIANCTICNNTYVGIYFYNVTDAIVTGCNICDNWYGIYLEHSFQNTITKSNISLNSEGGISILDSSSNNVSNCVICCNDWAGLRFNYSSDNNVQHCEVHSNNANGIYLDESFNNTISDCCVSNNTKNVNFANSNFGNTLQDSNIINAEVGIRFFTSSTNLITNCNVSGNEYGILFGGASIFPSFHNTVACCNIHHNNYGIRVESSKNNNTFYHNNLVNNTQNAYDECINKWDYGYPSGGNYFDDYSGVDDYHGTNQDISGSDGIGDTPYPISGGSNQDNYPLMEPWNVTICINISLKTGWNLITIPVKNNWMASTLAENITGCQMVSWFDAQNQTFRTHIVGVPGYDFEIKDGVGYFVYTNQNSTLTVCGPRIDNVSVPMYIGWNSIGWYHEYNTTASSIGENITDCQMVSWFDAEYQTFRTHIVGVPGYNFTITRGMGLFIYVAILLIFHCIHD